MESECTYRHIHREEATAFHPHDEQHNTQGSSINMVFVVALPRKRVLCVREWAYVHPKQSSRILGILSACYVLWKGENVMEAMGSIIQFSVFMAHFNSLFSHSLSTQNCSSLADLNGKALKYVRRLNFAEFVFHAIE